MKHAHVKEALGACKKQVLDQIEAALPYQDDVLVLVRDAGETELEVNALLHDAVQHEARFSYYMFFVNGTHVKLASVTAIPVRGHGGHYQGGRSTTAATQQPRGSNPGSHVVIFINSDFRFASSSLNVCWRSFSSRPTSSSGVLRLRLMRTISRTSKQSERLKNPSKKSSEDSRCHLFFPRSLWRRAFSLRHSRSSRRSGKKYM